MLWIEYANINLRIFKIWFFRQTFYFIIEHSKRIQIKQRSTTVTSSWYFQPPRWVRFENAWVQYYFIYILPNKFSEFMIIGFFTQLQANKSFNTATSFQAICEIITSSCMLESIPKAFWKEFFFSFGINPQMFSVKRKLQIERYVCR